MHCSRACLFVTLLLLPGLASAQTLQMDLQQTKQVFRGFGAQAWTGNNYSWSVLDELNLRYARLNHGTNFFTFPNQPPVDGDTTAGNNYAALRSYVAANFNGPNGSEPWHLPAIQSAASFADQHGVELILNEFKVPSSFVDANYVMPSNRIDDFATYWVALLSYLDENGVRPKYVELSNEPNGTWNGLISPSDYNTLVKQTRSLLDARGFADVGILGPGVSYLGDSARIDALDATGVSSLAGWSSHAWDDWQGVNQRAAILENATSAKDPDKPIFITEYATSVTTYAGVTYGKPEEGGNAADQEEFGVQVFHNSISLINHGAGALLMWEAADQAWSTKAWGAKRLDGTTRPMYDVMKTLTGRLPDDSLVVDPTWSDAQVSMAGFLHGDQLIVALANPTTGSQLRTLSFDNVPGELQLAGGAEYENGVTSPLQYTIAHNSLSVQLDAFSTQTLVFNIVPVLWGDYNENGIIDAADYSVWRDALAAGSTTLPNDPTPGTVDESDYHYWVQHFGQSLGAAAGGAAMAAAPEPSSPALFMLGIIMLRAQLPPDARKCR